MKINMKEPNMFISNKKYKNEKMRVSFNKIIPLLVAVFLFVSPENKLSAQVDRDSLAGFNEDSVRNAARLGLPPLTRPIPSTDIDGYMKFKKAEYAGKRKGTWETPISPNRSATMIVPPPGETCVNADFELGDFTSWQGKTGSNPSCCTVSGTFTGTTGLVSGRQTIVTGAGNDPIGGFPLVAPGGTYSARLGNNISGAQAEQLTKTFQVTTATTTYTYKYAVVLQDPGHDVAAQPYFVIQMFDQGGELIPCSYFKVVAGASIPGFQSASGCIYKPWTTNAVDLTAYIGQNVTIAFTTVDCAYGGHFGYAYIDGTCDAGTITADGTMCAGEPVNFSGPSGNYPNETYSWAFGDGGTSTSELPSHTYASPGTYPVTFSINVLDGSVCHNVTYHGSVTIINCREIPCTNCIGSFAPEAGDYILSAWVKEESAPTTELTYLNPQISIEFPSDPTLTSFTSAALGPFVAKGAIIDGWQRVEEKINVPANAVYINLKLTSLAGNCFFDDIRIFPVNGTMKSYVYDPVNLRLVAELDERNYATMYEYDEEGKLVRVKKETEKGIMTIKENKNNTKKK